MIHEILLVSATLILVSGQTKILLNKEIKNSNYTFPIVEVDGYERHFAFLLDSRKIRQLRRLASSPIDFKLQASDEVEYPKLHKCQDHGEVYAASYLITRNHLMNHFIDHNLSNCNTELASFMLMDVRMDAKKDQPGTLIQSLDVLDFSVIHLSAFERLQRRHRKSKGDKATFVKNCTDILYQKYLQKESEKTLNYSIESNKTVAVMPWLGSELGAGNSNVQNRLEYLKACFWSLYLEFQHVVVAVKSPKDLFITRNQSGLPFYDILYLGDLPTSHSLPVATLQVTRNRIKSGEWKQFEYIFFTESDQVLMIRQHEILYGHLNKYPRRVLVPHRLIPYPRSVITHSHGRELSPYGPYNWKNMTCCMPRQNCVNRAAWVNPRDKSLSFLNIYGLQVALGNCNFHAESFRACSLYSDRRLDVCP